MLIILRDPLASLLALSAMMHAALLMIASWLGVSSEVPPRLVPVMPGHFSVALQAVTVEVPKPIPVEPPKEMPKVITAPPEVPTPAVVPEEPKEEKPPEEKKEPEPKPEKPAPAATKPSPASRAMQGAVFDDAPGHYYNPPPAYPADALARKLDGYVVVLARIDGSGRVQTARVSQSSGLSSFDDSALTAVRGWVFYPAKRGGVAVTVEVEVPVRFEIREYRR